MFKITATTSGGLGKTLEDAQRAAESLDGNLVGLNIDPNNPQAAIEEMERTVDSKLAPYSGNPIVDLLAARTKQHYKERIMERAEAKAKQL